MARNLKHDRPELRLKDNIRREIERAAKLIDQSGSVDGWPSHMQPLARNPGALKALAEFFKSLIVWTDQTEGQWSPRNPPKEVVDCLEFLRKQRVIVPSSNGLTVDDWLAEPVEPDQREGDFRSVVNMFKDLWK